MFPVVAAAAGMGMCAQAIGHHLCKTSNPVLHEFWEAARGGNGPTVRRLLNKYPIPPDTRHHMSDASLIIELTDLKADSDALDWGLAQVMRILARAGWSLTVRRRVTDENALHLLACQPKQRYIAHRMKLLLETELAWPRSNSMLMQCDWVGHLPEDKAPAGDGTRRLREHLAAARKEIQRHVRQQQRAEVLQAQWDAVIFEDYTRALTIGNSRIARNHQRRNRQGRISVVNNTTVVNIVQIQGMTAVQVQAMVSTSGEQFGITLNGWS